MKSWIVVIVVHFAQKRSTFVRFVSFHQSSHCITFGAFIATNELVMSPEEEVAEDYKMSLDDLKSTARPIIGSLTTIAKENAEFAPTIAGVIEERIKTVC
jgi:hypothetical protein